MDKMLFSTTNKVIMKKLLFLSFVLMGCDAIQIVTTTPGTPAPPDPPVATALPFNIQGHRGARGLMPDNTIPSFMKGLDAGATTLEMDAAITKDEQVIISHDPFFVHNVANRPEGKKIKQEEEKNLNMYRMNYNEIKSYELGTQGDPSFPYQQKVKTYVPLLAEVIDSAEAHAKATKRPLPYYNIEIKSHRPFDNIFYPEVGKYVDLVIAVILKKHVEKRVIIQSFDVRALKYVHQKYPGLTLELNLDNLGSRTLADTLNSIGFVPNLYSTNYRIVTDQLIKQVQEKGMKIIPYVVNDINEMKRLKAMGVDGLMTDYPNMAKDNLK